MLHQWKTVVRFNSEFTQLKEKTRNAARLLSCLGMIYLTSLRSNSQRLSSKFAAATTPSKNPLRRIYMYLVTIDALLCFSVDKKTVTFDVHSQRPETGEKSTPNSADGSSFVDDAMTVTSGKEPSVMSVSSHTSQRISSFISLKPTEQVMLNFV